MAYSVGVKDDANQHAASALASPGSGARKAPGLPAACQKNGARKHRARHTSGERCPAAKRSASGNERSTAPSACLLYTSRCV